MKFKTYQTIEDNKIDYLPRARRAKNCLKLRNRKIATELTVKTKTLSRKNQGKQKNNLQNNHQRK